MTVGTSKTLETCVHCGTIVLMPNMFTVFLFLNFVILSASANLSKRIDFPVRHVERTQSVPTGPRSSPAPDGPPSRGPKRSKSLLQRLDASSPGAQKLLERMSDWRAAKAVALEPNTRRQRHGWRDLAALRQHPAAARIILGNLRTRLRADLRRFQTLHEEFRERKFDGCSRLEGLAPILLKDLIRDGQALVRTRGVLGLEAPADAALLREVEEAVVRVWPYDRVLSRTEWPRGVFTMGQGRLSTPLPDERLSSKQRKQREWLKRKDEAGLLWMDH